MEKNQGLCGLVYDYYETQIRFGFYRYGQCLPSISHICSAFHLGRTTVRAALAMLEKEGLIKTEERKPAMVVFQADSTQLKENMALYFVPRKDGITDFTESGDLIFQPLWEGVLLRLDSEVWELMQRRLKAARLGTMPLSVKFFLGILASWNNRLIINLFTEAVRYLRYPYLVDKENPVITDPKLRDLDREDAVTTLQSGISHSNDALVQELFGFMERSCGKYCLEPIPFRWNIYRQRPQLRYTLASRIIREIMYGKYPVGSCLPSLPRMEKQYGVSLTTLRRTLSLLEEMGVTRSFQGKGTVVLMEPVPVDLSKPEIRDGMRLYGESLQLLAMTVSGVSRFTLEKASEEKRRALKEDLKQIREAGRSHYCFNVFLKFVGQECPSALVRECYSGLEELLAWGYPFTLLRLKADGLNTAYEELVGRMENHLQQEDFTAFSEDWKRLLEYEEQQCPHFSGSCFFS